MADLALVQAGRVNAVESIVQDTQPAAEAISAGDAVRIDVANGRFTKANGTVAAEARIYGIALRSAQAGEAVTALRKGVIDGFELSALAYDAPVYLSNTDGKLGDIAGTVSTVVGRVIAGQSGASLLPAGADKLLFVDL